MKIVNWLKAQWYYRHYKKIAGLWYRKLDQPIETGKRYQCLKCMALVALPERHSTFYHEVTQHNA